MTEPQAPLADERSRNILLWLVAVGFFMQTLDGTIVNTALPAMAASLGESPLRMQSVVVAYSLTMAMLIPASGWIADRFGTRRVYVGAITLFVIGSVFCALSHNLGQMVASRVLQGLGGAFLLPVGRLSVLRAFPQKDFLRAMSFVAIPGLIGPLMGPTLGGWLVQYASWHWIFLINLPVGLLGALATLRYMPDSRGPKDRVFDLGGFLLLAFGMVAVSLSVEGVSGLGLPQSGMLVLLAFGLASIAGYWLHALRRPDPLFSPQLFRIASMRVGLLGNLFARLGSSCMPFLVPLLLQVGLGYPPLHAGLMMLPVAIAGMGMKRAAATLIPRLGYRRVLVGNTWLVGLMMLSFAWASADQPVWLRVAQLMAFGAFNSLQFTAMNTVTLKDLGPAQASSGNSLFSMVQMLAMSLGVGLAGAVLSAYGSHYGAGSATGALQALHATFLTMGVVTIAASAVFWQLSPADRGDGPPRDPSGGE